MHEMNGGATWQHWLWTTVRLLVVSVVMLTAIAFFLLIAMICAVFIMETIGSSDTVVFVGLVVGMVTLTAYVAVHGIVGEVVLAMFAWALGDEVWVIDD